MLFIIPIAQLQVSLLIKVRSGMAFFLCFYFLIVSTMICCLADKHLDNYSPASSTEIDMSLVAGSVKLMYMTAPSRVVAATIARTLVEERLAACVNIIGGNVESYYMWEGKLEIEKEEVVLFAKAVDTDAVISRVKTLHPFDVPCIVSFPVDNGEPSFLRWVQESSTPVTGRNSS